MKKTFSKVVLSTLVASTAVVALPIDASAHAATSTSYILSNSTIKAIKSGSFAYKNIHIMQSEKAMLEKLGEPIKMVQKENKRTYYYKGFKVITLQAGKSSTSGQFLGASGALGEGRYVYQIVVNVSDYTIDIDQLKAIYNMSDIDENQKTTTGIANTKNVIDFSFNRKKNSTKDYLKEFTIHLNDGLNVQVPYVELPTENVPYILQADTVKALHDGELAYKGIHLNEEYHHAKPKFGTYATDKKGGQIKITDDKGAVLTFHRTSDHSFMDPDNGFKEGKYYLNDIKLPVESNYDVSGNQIGALYYDLFNNQSPEKIGTGKYSLYIKYNMNPKRPDYNHVAELTNVAKY